jgi:hypothetical protein
MPAAMPSMRERCAAAQEKTRPAFACRTGWQEYYSIGARAVD